MGQLFWVGWARFSTEPGVWGAGPHPPEALAEGRARGFIDLKTLEALKPPKLS